MQFQIVVTPQTTNPMSTPSQGLPADATDILRQILEVQKEQLALQKQAAAAHDMAARWKQYLSKWQRDFPELPEACKFALPVLEKSYGSLISDMADHLRQHGSDALDNEFALADFLDRYGMRLSQLGSILSLVAILAEAATQSQAGEAQG